MNSETINKENIAELDDGRKKEALTSRKTNAVQDKPNENAKNNGSSYDETKAYENSTGRMITCDYCLKEFENSDVRAFHRRTCSKVERFCNLCDGKKLETDEDLHIHMKTKHNKNRLFFCECCYYVFASLSDLNTHKQSIQLNRTAGLVKPIVKIDKPAGWLLPTDDEVQRTNEVKENEDNARKSFRCGNCLKIFQNEGSRNRHRPTCSVTDRICTLCDNMLQPKEDIRVHMKQQHKLEQNLYTCDCCAYTFQSVQHLRSHKMSVRKCGEMGDSQPIVTVDKPPGWLLTFDEDLAERVVEQPMKSKEMSALSKFDSVFTKTVSDEKSSNAACGYCQEVFSSVKTGELTLKHVQCWSAFAHCVKPIIRLRKPPGWLLELEVTSQRYASVPATLEDSTSPLTGCNLREKQIDDHSEEEDLPNSHPVLPSNILANISGAFEASTSSSSPSTCTLPMHSSDIDGFSAKQNNKNSIDKHSPSALTPNDQTSSVSNTPSAGTRRILHYGHDDENHKEMPGRSISMLSVESPDVEEIVVMENKPAYKNDNEILDRNATEETYLCGYCPKKFRLKSSRRNHRRTCSVIERFCALCEKVLEFNEDLNVHMKQKHDIDRVFTCNCCCFTFETQFELISHKRSMQEHETPGDMKAIVRIAKPAGWLLKLEGDLIGEKPLVPKTLSVSISSEASQGQDIQMPSTTPSLSDSSASPPQMTSPIVKIAEPISISIDNSFEEVHTPSSSTTPSSFISEMFSRSPTQSCPGSLIHEPLLLTSPTITLEEIPFAQEFIDQTFEECRKLLHDEIGKILESGKYKGDDLTLLETWEEIVEEAMDRIIVDLEEKYNDDGTEKN